MPGRLAVSTLAPMLGSSKGEGSGEADLHRLPTAHRGGLELMVRDV